MTTIRNIFKYLFAGASALGFFGLTQVNESYEYWWVTALVCFGVFVLGALVAIILQGWGDICKVVFASYVVFIAYIYHRYNIRTKRTNKAVEIHNSCKNYKDMYIRCKAAYEAYYEQH